MTTLNDKNKYYYTIIICAIFKNESHILYEWINHYLTIGIDHIFLINDNSTDDYKSIYEFFSKNVTLFHNDICTNDTNRQQMIYDKYLKPILYQSKWVGIVDLDEFLYSPTNISIKDILNKYDKYSQITIDWLHFGSNEHIYQPISVISGFLKRANYDRSQMYYSYKSIFKTDNFINFGIHKHNVNGISYNLLYNDSDYPDLVINHYNLQSKDFYLNVKGVRGDVNNWLPSQNIKREIELFNKYDINVVYDINLYKLNKDNSYKCFIFNEPITDDVTLIITSCNRPSLLDATLESFIKMNTYPIKITYIIDDSGKIGCNDDVILKYKDILNIHSIYNNKNIGQIESIDKVYSYVKTKWIFHCEEDWLFIRPNFIEKSLKVFNDNPNEKIYTVWLRPHNHTSGHPIIIDNLNRGYYMMDRNYTYTYNNVQYTWCGMTFNPGLRKTRDCLKYHPYTLKCDVILYNNVKYVGEYNINKKYADDGYYAVILDDPDGYVKHIGDNFHIIRPWD